jgi:hypothetical protein
MNTTNSYLSERSQKEVAAGVLKQAKQDLRRFRGDTSKIGRELYTDAYRWFTAGECSWLFSFLNVCEVLNLAPESIRQELMSDLSLGTFGYWTRGCGFAALRVCLSFSEVLMSEPNNEARNTAFAKVAASTIPL